MVRTVLSTSAGPEGLSRRLVEVPRGSQFEGTAGPGGELWFVIEGAGRLTSGAGPGRAGPARHGGVAAARRTLPPARRRHGRAQAGQRHAARRSRRPGRDRDGGRDRGRRPGRCRGAAAIAAAGLRGGSNRGPPVPRPVRARQRMQCGHPVRGRDSAGPRARAQPPLRRGGAGSRGPGRPARRAGPTTPLAQGSCVHLPPGQPHCLENTGRATLRVLGVFHPGGSPASKR